MNTCQDHTEVETQTFDAHFHHVYYIASLNYRLDDNKTTRSDQSRDIFHDWLRMLFFRFLETASFFWLLSWSQKS